MMNSEKHGEIGERYFKEYIEKALAGLDIIWMRKLGRTNLPFDFEIYDDSNCICQIEVRTLMDGRKNYQVAFSKAQLRRKRKRNVEMGKPLIYTVLVRMMASKYEFRQAKGLPSKYFDFFSEDMDEMLNAIRRR